MNNKSLAIFGVVKYLLSVFASTTNLEGVSAVPVWVIMISGVASTIFTIMATIRLWKISKFVSVLFGSTSVIFCGFEAIQFSNLPTYGSYIVIFFNIVKLINLLTFFLAVRLLWRTRQEHT